MLQLHFNCIIETYLIFVMLLNGFIHPFLIPKGKCCRVKSKGLEIKLSWIQILALLFTTDCTRAIKLILHLSSLSLKWI